MHVYAEVAVMSSQLIYTCIHAGLFDNVEEHFCLSQLDWSTKTCQFA